MPATEETLVFWLYLTARIAAVIFLFAFVTRRRGPALAFVAAHTVHLGVIVIAAVTLGAARFTAAWPLTIVLGGAVYALVFALGYAAWTRRPPDRLEGVAYLVIWAALLRPLLFRAVEGRSALHIAFSLAFLGAAAVYFGSVNSARPSRVS